MSGIIKVKADTEGKIDLFYGYLRVAVIAHSGEREPLSFASGVINKLRASVREYDITIDEPTTLHRDLVEAIITARRIVTEPESFVTGWICSKVLFE